MCSVVSAVINIALYRHTLRVVLGTDPVVWGLLLLFGECPCCLGNVPVVLGNVPFNVLFYVRCSLSSLALDFLLIVFTLVLFDWM